MPIALVSLTNVFAEPHVELENKRLFLAQTYPCPRVQPGHIAPHLERQVHREQERDEQDAARVVANGGGDGGERAGRRALSPRAGPRGDPPGRTTQDRAAAFRAQIGAIPIQAQPLAENLTLLAGPGGNVVELHGSDGLVVVDTFVAPAWPKFQESLKGFGAPVKFVINTHWHFDHTDNNAPLRAGGATLVAHENTRLRMTQPHHLAVLELDFAPSPAAALPQRVFKDGYKLEANGERLMVTHA